MRLVCNSTAVVYIFCKIHCVHVLLNPYLTRKSQECPQLVLICYLFVIAIRVLSGSSTELRFLYLLLISCIMYELQSSLLRAAVPRTILLAPNTCA